MNKDVRAAASKFLVAALAEARRLKIVPTPHRIGRWDRYDGPWPAYWPCREIATSAAGAPLVAAMRGAYPDRFGTESKFRYKDPEEYIAALLRAVIAESVVHERSLSSRSHVAKRMMEELEQVVLADGQRFACLWVISDVEFQAVDGARIGPVKLMPQHSQPEIGVSMHLPEALWVGEGYPLPGAKHQGLLYGSGIGAGHHWDVTRPLNDAIARFLTLLRLATATTSLERVVWTGEPSMIHVEMPSELPQPGEFMESRWRRVAIVTPDQLTGLSDLTAMLDQLDPEEPKRALPAVVVAMRRYSRSFRSGAWQDTVLDLATALEACLGPSTREEIGLTLRTRAAHLLAHDASEQAEAIYTDIEDLYTVRSDIIHGRAKLQKDLGTLWAARGYTHLLEHDRLHVLLDRWREIIRRAISARLMLGDDRLGPPLWPLTPRAGREVKVDLSLVRRDHRDEWRGRIVSGAAAYGLPLLAEMAPPLIDYLHHDPDKT